MMPSFIRAEVVPTSYGKFGYIRIFSFDVEDADKLVSEFIRLVKCLPQNGLIVDVRDNGGGRTSAAERLLQLVSPRQPIEPERMYFINNRRTFQLCRLQQSNLKLGPFGLAPWIESIQRSMENGAMYSSSFPYTNPEACNAIGRLYRGRVIVRSDGESRRRSRCCGTRWVAGRGQAPLKARWWPTRWGPDDCRVVRAPLPGYARAHRFKGVCKSVDRASTL